MMLTINTCVFDDSTIGRVQYGDFKCFSLELPWRNNERNVSCIPSGIYGAIKHDSVKNGLCILLPEVHGRDMIQIHSGNFTRQIEGCILVGDSIKHLDSDNIPDVTNSRITLNRLMSALPDGGFKIHIQRTAALPISG